MKAVEGGYEIAVAGEKAETLVGKHIIVATGSNARALPGTPFDEKQILSNDGALAIMGGQLQADSQAVRVPDGRRPDPAPLENGRVKVP